MDRRVSFFPSPPTLVLSANKGTPGQTVNVGDAPGHTSFWWVSTLSALVALLGGSASPPAVNVSFGKGSTKVPVVSNAAVAPASYVKTVFTPPVLSGTFTVPQPSKGSKINVTTELDRLRLRAVDGRLGALHDQGGLRSSRSRRNGVGRRGAHR